MTSSWNVRWIVVSLLVLRVTGFVSLQRATVKTSSVVLLNQANGDANNDDDGKPKPLTPRFVRKRQVLTVEEWKRILNSHCAQVDVNAEDYSPPFYFSGDKTLASIQEERDQLERVFQL